MSCSIPTGWNQPSHCSRKEKQMDSKWERYLHDLMWIESLFSGTGTHACTTSEPVPSYLREQRRKSFYEHLERIGGPTMSDSSLNSPESIFVHTRLSGATISSSLPIGGSRPSSR